MKIFMEKLEPILTEKSTKEAKRGNYTFWVEKDLNKNQIKSLVNKIFGVHVVTVKTANLKKVHKRSPWGKKRKIPARKKTIVTLRQKEKIDLFETKE